VRRAAIPILQDHGKLVALVMAAQSVAASKAAISGATASPEAG